MTDNRVARAAALDAITAARKGALADLAQAEAIVSRVHDATVTIDRHSRMLQEIEASPANLAALLTDARGLVDRVAALTSQVARIDQWGRMS